MFIASGRNWYAGTEQRSSGTFLLLCLPETPAEKIETPCPWPGNSEWAKEGEPGNRCEGKATTWPAENFTCSVCGRDTIAHFWHAQFSDIRCFVRHVELHQCGHWMMGDMTVHGEKIILSGAYGDDGGPQAIRRKTWEKALPLPAELIEALKNGGGHNSFGTEGMSIRTWANENLKALRAASRKVRSATAVK